MRILTGSPDDDPDALLPQARDYLASGDLQQASGRAWDATAHALIAVAESSGWPHHTHRDLFVAIERIARETGDQELVSLMGSASVLDTNFHEGWLPRETVERNLSRVTTLVEKLGALRA